jgi:predicted dehydrogenase
MRVGVVGCGYWGSKHVRVLQSLREVDRVVVVDPRDQVREELLASFAGMTGARTLDEALDLVDAVVIATPPATHARLGHQAISAGKHVLIEKPLATSASEARDLIAGAEAAGVTLMVGHTFEYNAAVWELRHLVHSRELGRVYYIDAARLNLGLYQPDVNVIWDLAPHDVSILNFVLGDVPDTVEAWGARHAHSTLEDVAYLRLSYRDIGVTAQIHVSWLDPCKVRRVTVVGSRKMAVYNDLNQDERVRVYDKGVTHEDLRGDGPGAPMTYRYGSITSPHISFQEPLLLEDRHFIECITQGCEPTSNGASGLVVVSVLEAAERSLRSGGPVDLDPHVIVLDHPSHLVAG